jgi:hypothetical protein
MMSRHSPISKITAIRQAIRSFLVGEDGIAGSALIEFTLLAPLLVVASIYTTDFGLYLCRNMQVQNAAQAGVDWAIANRIFNDAAIRAAATNATNYTVSLPTDSLNPNPQLRCGCPSSTGVVTSGYTYNSPTATLVRPVRMVRYRGAMSLSRRRPHGIRSFATACSPAPTVTLGPKRQRVSNDTKSTTR